MTVIASIGAPSSISAAARSALGKRSPVVPFPEPDDTEGWLAHVAEVDAAIVEVLAAEGTVVETTTRTAGDVPVAVLQPDRAPVDGPVFCICTPEPSSTSEARSPRRSRATTPTPTE